MDDSGFPRNASGSRPLRTSSLLGLLGCPIAEACPPEYLAAAVPDELQTKSDRSSIVVVVVYCEKDETTSLGLFPSATLSQKMKLSLGSTLLLCLGTTAAFGFFDSFGFGGEEQQEQQQQRPAASSLGELSPRVGILHNSLTHCVL